MNATLDRQRIAGAFRFVAELSAVAEECAATGAWSDELTARRRQRVLSPKPARAGSEERRAKAL
jgi:hypothetical protein